MWLAFPFILGLILAMSDGTWFPYGNIVGVGLVALVGWRANVGQNC